MGLGSEFLSDLDDCLRIAREFPEAGTPYELSTRRLLFHRFPFALIYIFDQSRIEIVAVAHQRQEPGYWQMRG
jgi:plasmid stabilization system protein ParE